jgi:hypothetical protein
VAMDGEIEQLQNDLKNAYHPFCFLGWNVPLCMSF